MCSAALAIYICMQRQPVKCVTKNVGLRVHIAIKLSFRFVNITIAVYGAVSEIFDHGFGFSFKEMGLLVDALYCSILLFVFCDCSHKSTLTVKKNTHTQGETNPTRTIPNSGKMHSYIVHFTHSFSLAGWLAG